MADALKAVATRLSLLHVTKEGHTQWILNDRRLCDQGVESGDTVVLLSTSSVSQGMSQGVQE